MTPILSHTVKSRLLTLLRALRWAGGGRTIVKNEGLKANGKSYNRQRFYGPRKLFCYAPFRSLFVSYNGRVSPCYACKAEASLRNATLEEVWNGETFGALRKQMEAGIIPDACSFCRGHLKNGNYGSILAAKYDHHAAPNNGFPAIIEFELGNQCQLECVMCTGELSSSIRAHREQKPPVSSIVDTEFQRHFEFCLPRLRAAEFTGGDPFLIPVYEKIWKRMEEVNPLIDILITTNANTMTEKVEALLNTDLKLSFNVSIDSLKKETYESIRINARFENVLQNIGRFADYAKKHQTSIGFLVCPIRLNSYELPDFIGFAQKHGASLSYHVVFKPANLALWTLPSAELENLSQHLQKFRFKGNSFLSRINARNYNSLADLISVWAEKAALREKASVDKENEMLVLIQNSRQMLWKNLASLVENDDLQHHVKRVEFLITRLEKENHPGLVYIKLAEMPVTDILSGLNSMKDAELMEKLNLYHNDIYYRLFAGEGLSDNDKYELSMKGMSW